jgi:hypothetical protein
LISRQDNEGSVRSGGVDTRLETPYGEWLVVLFANLSGQVLVSVDMRRSYSKETYRIDGGVPAGIFMSSLESGERAKSIKITMITRHGNRRTRANGTETDESPVSRTRRLKKLARGAVFSARRGASSVCSGLSPFWFGSLLVTSWKSAIAMTSTPGVVNVCCPRQLFR